MKIFEIIHLILLGALFIGVPVAASTRPDGQQFSVFLALKQGAIVAGVILALLVCNFVLAQLASRAAQKR